MIVGQAVAVRRRFLGAQLLTAVGSADQILYVDALEDFDEDGGAVRMSDGRVLDFLFANPDTLTIQLTGPAGAPYPIDDAIQPEPPAVRYLVDVVLDDDDSDAVVAVIPHYLIPLLGEGQVDPADPRAVLLDDSSPGSLTVVDVINRDAEILGSYVDPDDLIPPDTDGLPPGSSPTPTVTSAIGAIVVTWTGIANDSPVMYEVHVAPMILGRAATGEVRQFLQRLDQILGDQVVAPVSRRRGRDLYRGAPRSVDSTWVGEVAGTSFWIRRLPNGDPLVPGAEYGVWIIAKDADGEAAPSATISGTPGQATDADLAVGSVTADQIVAGAVTAEKLAATLILATEIIAGDPESQHVRQSGIYGLQLVAADGSVLVAMPVDPSQSATFRGNVQATAIDILQGLTLRGTTNIMGPGSKLTLRGKLDAPLAVPTLKVDWERIGLLPTDAKYRAVAYDSGRASFWVGQDTVDSAGSASWIAEERRASDGAIVKTLGGPRWGYVQGGIAAAGGKVYVGTQVWSTPQLLKFDAASGAFIVAVDLTPYLLFTSNGFPGDWIIGYDVQTGAVLLMDCASVNETNQTQTLRVRTITLSDSGTVGLGAAVGLGGSTFDGWKATQGIVGAEGRYWVQTAGDRFFGSVAKPYTKAGALVADQDFGFPAAPIGLCHDGTRFWSLVGSDLVRHTNWNWTTESARYWIGNSWYEDVH